MVVVNILPLSSGHKEKVAKLRTVLVSEPLDSFLLHHAAELPFDGCDLPQNLAFRKPSLASYRGPCHGLSETVILQLRLLPQSWS